MRRRCLGIAGIWRGARRRLDGPSLIARMGKLQEPAAGPACLALSRWWTARLHR